MIFMNMALSNVYSRMFYVVLMFYCCTSVTNSQRVLEATIEFAEEQDVGTYVGNVVVASDMRDADPQVDMSQLEFTLQKTDYFKIKKNSGILESAVKIDRDTICAGETDCIINAEVVVYNVDPFDIFSVINVKVVILDINDNPPEFPSNDVVLTVPENNVLDEELRTSAAADKDVGENGVASYSFVDPTETFTLKVHTSGDGSTYLGIVIKQRLDREENDFYQVMVLASDGASNRKRHTSTCTITIKVSDLNDNDPEFDQTSYNVSVPEDVSVNVPILRVKATDSDTGPNADITYQISSQVSENIRRVFGIDEKGEIFAKEKLNYEQTPRYQLVVEAVDNGSPARSSRVSVMLIVADVNDNSPEISINLPPQGTDISEDEPEGKFIAHVSVQDKDHGPNAKVLCFLDDNHFALEKFGVMDENMFKVVLAKPLNHEASSSHRVTITCTDGGQPPRSNSTNFVVNVVDVNDERPTFSESTYRGNLLENHKGPLEILTVKAYDGDSGEMGRVSYSLEDRYDGLFVIDPESGIITATKPVDREHDAASFEFHVIARDNGKVRRSGTALVVVDVDDVNDEAPKFPRASFVGRVLENEPAGTVVGNVTATDPDTSSNGEIKYSILQQGTDFSKFRINQRTGEIKTADVFDREDVDRYQITVQASDPDKPEFYSTCNFTAIVLDDNDHSPIITSLGSGQPVVKGEEDNIKNYDNDDNATFIIQHTAVVGSVITRIRAFDGDDQNSPNAQLSFSILSGNTNRIFSMNRQYGSIALARAVTAEDIKTFKLLIEVRDGGDPPMSDSKDVYIKINGSIAAFSESSSGGIGQNILIVVILIGVTIVLALAIVAAICLIRKIDRQRRINRNNQKVAEDKMYQLSEPSHHNQDNVFANRSSNDYEGDHKDKQTANPNIYTYTNNLSKYASHPPTGNGVAGTKKEVSFSLDEESDSHNTSSGSGQPLTSFKGGGGDRRDGTRAAGSSRSIKNGGMNIPVGGEKSGSVRRSPHNDECHLIEILKKSADDALSESSGETDPSDSGRGGSEDECSHRGSGHDPENVNKRMQNGKGIRSPSSGKNREQNPHYINHKEKGRINAVNNNVRTTAPTRQLSSSSSNSAVNTGASTSSFKGRPINRFLDPTYGTERENPRDSLTSDFGSDLSSYSRPASQSRTDSDRSVPPPPAPRPPKDIEDEHSLSQMLPFQRPSPITTNHTPSSSISSSYSTPRDFNTYNHNRRASPSNPDGPSTSSRVLLTRDSPNRLIGHHNYNNNYSNYGDNINVNSSYNNSLLRSFHGRPTNSRHSPDRLPSLSSISTEHIPRSSTSSSSTNPSPFYHDRPNNGFYPAIPDRWDRTTAAILGEEDDITTTSGSYSINPDDLRQEIDELILQDSVV